MPDICGVFSRPPQRSRRAGRQAMAGPRTGGLLPGGHNLQAAAAGITSPSRPGSRFARETCAATVVI